MQLEGNVRRFAPVDPKGLKTTVKPAALKAAKQNSSLVAKIKTKIQNTSSFFKVSLKTNNKALALALVAQKEKSRLLETETVHLRKEVQALCFDLALRRHKHNQLVKLLKDLQASALSSIVAAVDLLSAEDDATGAPEEINEECLTEPEDANTELGSELRRVPVLSEQIGKLTYPSPKKQTRESSRSPKDQLRNPPEEIHTQPNTAILPRVKGQGSTCTGHTETAEDNILPVQEKIARRPPSGLQLELDKWSRIYLDTPLEPEPIPASLAVVNSPSAAEPLPEPPPVEPKESSGSTKVQSPRPERTSLFETEMEITLGGPAAEIVTVETKPKKVKKESVAKLKKKETVPLDDTRCPDKEEKKKKKKKKKMSSSVHREETPSTNAPPTQGWVLSPGPASCRPLNPVGLTLAEERKKEAEPVDGDADLLAARRNVHVTSRSGKNRRTHAPKSSGAFSGEGTVRKTYIISLDDDDHHMNAASVTPLEDDYFSSTKTSGSGIKEKDIFPWDVDTRDDEGPRGKMRKTYIVETSQSSSAINRKTYVISDDVGQVRATTKSWRTKALSLKMENEPGVEGHGMSDPGHAEEPAVDEASLLAHQSGPGLAGKRKGPFSEGPPAPSWAPTGDLDAFDSPVVGENLSWKILSDPPSAIVTEPKPKRCRKEGGTREGKKERKEGKRDDICAQVKKTKKKTSCSQKEKGLAADVPASLDHSETHRPAPCGSVSLEPKEFWEKQPENWGIVRASVKSRRKNDLSITNIVSLDDCDSGNSVGAIVATQPLDFPFIEANEGAMRTVTLAHVSASSEREENKENDARSCTAEAQKSVVKKDVFWGRNVQVSQEQTDTPLQQTCRVANRSVVSGRQARGPASAKSQRSKAPLVGRDSKSEMEVLAGGISTGPPSPEGTRESLRKLILEERPPWEPLDNTCISFPEWETPAPSPLSKPTPARVAVFKEQSDRAPEGSAVSGVLKSLTNTAVTTDPGLGRVRRRGNAAVSYKEPSINCKMRRGDKFSDTKFLSSPIFKDKKKKMHAQKPEIHTGHCFNDMD